MTKYSKTRKYGVVLDVRNGSQYWIAIPVDRESAVLFWAQPYSMTNYSKTRESDVSTSGSLKIPLPASSVPHACF